MLERRGQSVEFGASLSSRVVVALGLAVGRVVAAKQAVFRCENAEFRQQIGGLRRFRLFDFQCGMQHFLGHLVFRWPVSGVLPG